MMRSVEEIELMPPFKEAFEFGRLMKINGEGYAVALFHPGRQHPVLFTYGRYLKSVDEERILSLAEYENILRQEEIASGMPQAPEDAAVENVIQLPVVHTDSQKAIDEALENPSFELSADTLMRIQGDQIQMVSRVSGRVVVSKPIEGYEHELMVKIFEMELRVMQLQDELIKVTKNHE